VTEFKIVKFPSQGTVFDYYLDSDTKKWTPWSEKVPKYCMDPDMPLQVKMITMLNLLLGLLLGRVGTHSRNNQISLLC